MLIQAIASDCRHNGNNVLTQHLMSAQLHGYGIADTGGIAYIVNHAASALLAEGCRALVKEQKGVRISKRDNFQS